MRDKDKLRRLEEQGEKYFENCSRAMANGDVTGAINLHRKWRRNLNRQHEAIRNGDWDYENYDPDSDY